MESHKDIRLGITKMYRTQSGRFTGTINSLNGIEAALTRGTGVLFAPKMPQDSVGL